MSSGGLDMPTCNEGLFWSSGATLAEQPASCSGQQHGQLRGEAAELARGCNDQTYWYLCNFKRLLKNKGRNTSQILWATRSLTLTALWITFVTHKQFSASLIQADRLKIHQFGYLNPGQNPVSGTVCVRRSATAQRWTKSISCSTQHSRLTTQCRQPHFLYSDARRISYVVVSNIETVATVGWVIRCVKQWNTTNYSQIVQRNDIGCTHICNQYISANLCNKINSTFVCK